MFATSEKPAFFKMLAAMEARHQCGRQPADAEPNKLGLFIF